MLGLIGVAGDRRRLIFWIALYNLFAGCGPFSEDFERYGADIVYVCNFKVEKVLKLRLPSSRRTDAITVLHPQGIFYPRMNCLGWAELFESDWLAHVLQ